MNEKLELLKKQLDQLTVMASKAFDLQMASLACGAHSSVENDREYRKASSAFMDSIDEMRKLIVKGYDLC
jgi:hypothetical protein